MHMMFKQDKTITLQRHSSACNFTNRRSLDDYERKEMILWQDPNRQSDLINQSSIQYHDVSSFKWDEMANSTLWRLIATNVQDVWIEIVIYCTLCHSFYPVLITQYLWQWITGYNSLTHLIDKAVLCLHAPNSRVLTLPLKSTILKY